MGKVSKYGLTTANMKETGRKIRLQVKVPCIILMAMSMKEIGIMIRQMETVLIRTLMGPNTLASGKTINSTDME